MADQHMKVIIIGAGATGLLLGQGLKRAGINYSIYEREDPARYAGRPREWGMTLHWGAEYIRKCLSPELQARLPEVRCDPYYTKTDTSIPYANGKTGETIFFVHGADLRRVSRRKLRALLSEGLDINYGKELVSLSPADNGIVADFADGTTAAGDLVVGCDSSKSAVREILVGKEAAQNTFVDITMLNFSCSYPADVAVKLRARHPVINISHHPDLKMIYLLSIQDVPDPDKPDTWLFQNLMSWMGPPYAEDFKNQADRTSFFQTKAKEFAEPWCSSGREIPEGLVFPADRCTNWTPSMSWSDTKFGARVTLAGDAAHNIAPHRGQGLNNALQDSVNLVDQLEAVVAGTKSLTEAITTYETEMKARAVLEISLSLQSAQMLHNWETLLQSPMAKMGLKKQQEHEAELAAANANGKDIDDSAS